MLFVVVTAALSLGAQFENVPLEWTCSPFQYDNGDGCDCGCGVIDPDCGVADGPLLPREACSQDGCGGARVPTLGDPTRCTDNECGDGYVANNELCDDGDAVGEGDGCSDDCLEIKAGFRCSKEGGGCSVPGCGDRIVDVQRGEQCDDGNDDIDDGCGGCLAEVGYVCSTFQPCRQTVCGDGFVELDFETRSGEGCDDGNGNADDGCDQCVVSDGFICDPFDPRNPCFRTICGNFNVEQDPIGRGEGCDDGDTDDGDGCDSECQVEDGFACDRFGVCAPLVCGNGVLQFPEQCDDGNDDNRDGCAGDCSGFEAGFACGFDGGPCHAVVCGDGIAEGDNLGTVFEDCDDQNDVAGDGCTGCRRDPGSICLPDGTCHAQVCGDGLLDTFNVGGSEVCDDGNTVRNDGCSADCSFVEVGFFCPVPGEPCVQPECGDGVVEGAESCDDANADAGDGCDADCGREDDFVCRVPGAPCEPLPEAWLCSRFVYGAGDGCDCGCGVKDLDCPADFDAGDCDFNQCLDDAPFVDAADPTSCSDTFTPPAEGEGEGEEGAEGEGEDDPRLSGGGCACASGGSALPLLLPPSLLLPGLLRRRRR